jgi:hypothetical protein
MRFQETTFDEYLTKESEMSLHPKLKPQLESFPSDISDLRSVIVYGPPGVGKYTQALKIIAKYSSTNLKYEKKLALTTSKGNFLFKMSDVHFEVDMGTLGCNSKILWNEVYMHVNDVLASRSSRVGIILCRSFHSVHNELLESFYSYMQTKPGSATHIKFVILTEQLSFLPDNLTGCSVVIRVPRPSKALYGKCLGAKAMRRVKPEEISNMKCVTSDCETAINVHERVCNSILSAMLDKDGFSFVTLRERLYEMLIFNLDVHECIRYIVETLVSNDQVKQEDMSDVLLVVYKRIQLYNNNYRPIYHLEALMVYLITKIHGFQESV